MTLQEWIRSQGGQRECARKFNFPAASVGAWYRLERYPRPHTQQKLQQLAHGEIDFRKLMKEYLIAQRKRNEKCLKITCCTNTLIRPDIRSELPLKHVLERSGMRPQQPEWQARIIYASWAGKEISTDEFRQVLNGIREKGEQLVDLFQVDKILSQLKAQYK
ncbi:MAG: hypothetical protein QM578_26465 [Pantoea sp.]|uniref:hypothetical protein n=1 Tax=Pantoea sp. TaxID=69393 RepID=UPI0039E42CF6